MDNHMATDSKQEINPKYQRLLAGVLDSIWFIFFLSECYRITEELNTILIERHSAKQAIALGILTGAT